MQQPFLVFVDSSARPHLNLEELRDGSGDQVRAELFSYVDPAWSFIQKYIRNLTGIVLEIVLGEGKLFAGRCDAQDGFNTGILFAEEIRNLRPDCPIAFLTTQSPTVLGARLQRDILDKNYLYYQKTQWMPNHFLTDLAAKWNFPYRDPL